MKKPYAIWDKSKKKFVEFFEYPEQAINYINKKLMGSKNFNIIDKRKKR